LKEITKNNIQFKVLGFVTISDIIKNYDYVMLYSKVEGLPTILIEACMYSKPIICNDVGGNLEILDENINGFLADSYESLRQKLNSLPDRNSDEYKSLCFNSRQKYLSSFTFQKMVDNYINTITQ
jgi:glycosyltransferase involved in cell wall biosynthesis